MPEYERRTDYQDGGRLTHIEGKIDRICEVVAKLDERSEQQAADITETKEFFKTINGRISSLETWSNRIKGAIFIIGTWLGFKQSGVL